VNRLQVISLMVVAAAQLPCSYAFPRPYAGRLCARMVFMEKITLLSKDPKLHSTVPPPLSLSSSPDLNAVDY